MTLGAKGYILLTATDGGEALDIALKERPDLIMMDIQLPKVSGLTVTRKLRENPECRHIPIIAITASAMKGDRERIIEAGCDAYLSKPINTRQLPGIVKEIMLSHHQEDNIGYQRSNSEKESPGS